MAKILTPLLGPLAHLFAGLATDLGDFLVGLSGGGHTTTKNLGKLITQLGTDAQKSGLAFKKLGEDIGDILGPVSQVFGPLATFLNLMTNGPMKASNAFHEWMLSASKDVNTWLKTIPGDFSKIWNTIVADAKAVPGEIANWFKSLPGDIWSWISTIRGDFSKIWSDVLSDVESLIGKIVAWFAKLPGEIAKAVGNISIGGISLSTIVNAIPKAVGGPVLAGVPYIVGENGPELFMPSQSGNIIPNGATVSGRPIQVTFETNINGSGLSQAQLQATIAGAWNQMAGRLQQQILAAG
jgi:hypothetical protein